MSAKGLRNRLPWGKQMESAHGAETTHEVEKQPPAQIHPRGYTEAMPVPTHRGLIRILFIVLLVSVTLRADHVRTVMLGTN